MNGPGINHRVSPISSPSDTRHHQGGINRLILIPKISPSPEPLITINSRLLLSIGLFKGEFRHFYCWNNFKISFYNPPSEVYEIHENKRLQVPVGILGLLNTDCALNAFLAPGFIRNQWQEKYTVCSHSKASRFPFCNFGAIWQQLTTFGNPIIYQDHKMNAIFGFWWRNIIIITLSSLQIQKLRTTAGHSNFKKQISIVKWTPRWERKIVLHRISIVFQCLSLQKAEAQLAYELQAAKIQQGIKQEELQIQVFKSFRFPSLVFKFSRPFSAVNLNSF